MIMNNCKEFALDDLMAITAIPVAGFSPDAASWQLTPTIRAAAFSPTLTGAIVIGLQPATAGGKLVPIVRATGKAKDSEADGVAGRSHTVSVSCEVDDRDLTADGSGKTVLDHLLALERTPSHLLLTFRDDTRAFAAATADTYTCEVERSGSKTSVTLKVHNLMGIQLIIPSPYAQASDSSY